MLKLESLLNELRLPTNGAGVTFTLLSELIYRMYPKEENTPIGKTLPKCTDRGRQRERGKKRERERIKLLYSPHRNKEGICNNYRCNKEAQLQSVKLISTTCKGFTFTQTHTYKHSHTHTHKDHYHSFAS